MAGIVQGKGGGVRAGETGTEAGGTHPTGKHFLFSFSFCQNFTKIIGYPPHSWGWRSPHRVILDPPLTHVGGKCEKSSTLLSDIWG